MSHAGPRTPKFKPSPSFHNQRLSAAICVPLRKKANEDFLIIKVYGFVDTRPERLIYRQPQVVNEQLLWLIQRDQVFQTTDQDQVLRHFLEAVQGMRLEFPLLESPGQSMVWGKSLVSGRQDIQRVSQEIQDMWLCHSNAMGHKANKKNNFVSIHIADSLYCTSETNTTL